MTIIAACVDQDGLIWMGSDCISLHRNTDVKISSRSKVFRLGETLIGGSGTTRCGQIVERGITPGEIPANIDPYEWLIETFIPVLRAAMKDRGGEIAKDGAHEMDIRLLIGLRGKLYEIDTGYGIIGHRSCYATIGCADKEAEAAMLTTLKLVPDMHARAVVQYGLEAAAELDINIRPPFEIMCSREETVVGLHEVA
jgi:hypothetical protein